MLALLSFSVPVRTGKIARFWFARGVSIWVDTMNFFLFV